MENFIAAHAANDAGFIECARLTAGEDYPLWLPGHYQGWSPSIMLDIGVHSIQPPRKQARKDLEEISQFLRKVDGKLKRRPIVEFLEMKDLGRITWLEPFRASLQDIVRRADYALGSLILVNKDGKTKAGAGRALPPGTSSPRAFCAAVVLETWAHLHNGEYPAPSNRHLVAVADEYWNACGGIAFGWGDNRNPSWIRYFKEALGPQLSKERQELKRHLALHEQFG